MSNIKPAILDGGHQIILAKLQKEMCSYNNNIQINIPVIHMYCGIEASYAIVMWKLRAIFFWNHLQHVKILKWTW